MRARARTGKPSLLVYILYTSGGSGVDIYSRASYLSLPLSPYYEKNFVISRREDARRAGKNNIFTRSRAVLRVCVCTRMGEKDDSREIAL